MSARAGCHAPHGARRKIVRIQASWASLPPLIGRKRDRDAMAGDGGGSDDEMDIEAQAHVTDSESVHSVGSSFGLWRRVGDIRIAAANVFEPTTQPPEKPESSMIISGSPPV